MRILVFVFVILFGITDNFSQTLEVRKGILTDEFFTNFNSNSIDDSLKVKPTLFISNDEFDRVLISGFRWGVYGGTIGLLSAYGMDLGGECDKGLCYVFVPPISASVGFISGLISGVISENKMGLNSAKLKYGLKFVYEGYFSAQKKSALNYGFVYRRQNKNLFLPDNVYFYFGQEEWNTRPDDPDQNYIPITESVFNLDKYGIELININYNRLFSLIYGVGFGYSTGRLRKYDRVSTGIVDKSIHKSVFTDLLLGLNVNLFKFLHFRVSYKYEPFGTFNGINNKGEFKNSVKQSFSFSAECFLF